MYICIYIYMLCGAFSDAFQPERKMAGNGEIDFQQAKTLPLDNFSILDHPWFCQIRLWEMLQLLQSSGKQAVSVWTRPRIVWNVLYSWTFSMLRWCTGWQSSSMAKEGKELVPFFHRFFSVLAIFMLRPKLVHALLCRRNRGCCQSTSRFINPCRGMWFMPNSATTTCSLWIVWRQRWGG